MTGENGKRGWIKMQQNPRRRNTSASRKKRSRSSETVDDFTRDINFSLKLARQDSPRGGDQDCLASKRHERRVTTAEKKRRRSTPAKRTAGGDGVKKKAVAATAAGEKCRGEKCRGETRCASPWRGTSGEGSSPWWRKRRSPFSRRGSNYGGRSDSHLRALYHRPS